MRTDAVDQMQTVNVEQVIESQPLRPFTWRVFALCFIIMLSEGYDLGVMGYAASDIHHSFHIARAQMAPVFSLGLAGMLVGSLGAGIVGDRFGRKRGILISLALISAASFACGWASSLNMLVWCRLLVGLGLGGLIPNVTALMAEFLPRRVRGRFVAYAFMGITFGGILPGLVATLTRDGDWRTLFTVGALIPLVTLPLIAAFLPESAKFLAARGFGHDRLRHILKAIAPNLGIDDNARFELGEPEKKTGSLAPVFSGRLLFMTPLLWVCFACIMLVNFFINSWLTLILTDLGFTAKDAASTMSLYYVGGVCGGLLVGVALDRIGSIALVANSILGAVIVVLLGLPQLDHNVIRLLVLLIGFSVLGTQLGMSSTAGMIYPTVARSKGAGFAHSVGRLGAISGPLIAGRLISNDASTLVLFLVPVVPLLLAALSFLLITRLWTGRLAGVGFRELHAASH